jgi:biotin transport system substrate-specific component
VASDKVARRRSFAKVRSRRNHDARAVVRPALFAALTAVGAQLMVPLPFSPVPIVLSNLVAVLSGLILGPQGGAIAETVYVLVGAAGLPVYAGFHGGMGVLFGPTGGYLVGFVIAATVAGMLRGRPWLAALTGLAVIYVPGLLWLSAVARLTLWKAFLLGFLPFVPGDALKAVAAVVVARAMSAAQSSDGWAPDTGSRSLHESAWRRRSDLNR